jgi:hypothetical protein
LQVLADTGCLDNRRCTLTFEVTCWVVLAMGWLTEFPIRQVFEPEIAGADLGRQV